MRETDEVTREILVVETNRKEIAKNFIVMGLDNLTIATGTGLTIEQVEELRNETA
jgi:hypothetical protein